MQDRYTSLLSLLERAVGSTRAFIVAADKALTDTQPQIRAVQNARATVEVSPIRLAPISFRATHVVVLFIDGRL